MTSNFSRRSFLATSATSAIAAGSSAPAAAPHAQKRPNVLFILTDQWRFSSFGHSTDGVVRTPHIDQLGAEGAVCTRAYAANPVCTPNRSCLLTGRYSHQTGMITNNLMLPPTEVCWPQIFADAGYKTHYIGKWHMDGTEKPGYVPPGWRRRGLTTFEGFNRGHVYHTPWGFADDGSPLIPKDVGEAPDYYEPTYQTDLAIKFMKQNRDTPFACYLSLGPPHTPFRPPKDFDLYSESDIQLRPNVPQQHEKQARKDLAGYFGLCESLDHEVGRLLEHLSTSGLAENTLVIFTSDHGELAGSHGKYRKGEPEEESLHVPLVARMPGKIEGGREVDALINSIDIMPTLLSLCGLKDPGTCSGKNMADALCGSKSAERQDAIYCEGKLTSATTAQKPKGQKKSGDSKSWRSVVTDRYKLTVSGGERRVAHLFDLKNDPFEQKNLATISKHRAVRDDLVDRLIKFRDSSGDSWPEKPIAAKVMYEA